MSRPIPSSLFTIDSAWLSRREQEGADVRNSAQSHFEKVVPLLQDVAESLMDLRVEPSEQQTSKFESAVKQVKIASKSVTDALYSRNASSDEVS